MLLLRLQLHSQIDACHSQCLQATFKYACTDNKIEGQMGACNSQCLEAALVPACSDDKTEGAKRCLQ